LGRSVKTITVEGLEMVFGIEPAAKMPIERRNENLPVNADARIKIDAPTIPVKHGIGIDPLTKRMD
jgi:hypothetical protein